MTIDFTILDGGMGRELKEMSAPFRQPEWSALALIEAPHFVTQAHENFINAGAQIITTNTFAVVPHHIGQGQFEKTGLDLVACAMNCALDAVKKTGKHTKIAASIPPLFGAYEPHLFNKDTAESILKPLIKGQEKQADLWLIETLSCLTEAAFSLNMIKQHSDKDVWIAFCLKENAQTPQLYDGTPIEKVYTFAQKNNIQALLFNCSSPEDIDKALNKKPQSFNKKLGAYPNLFEPRNNAFASNEGLSGIREDITIEAFCQYAQSCVSQGASIIGGCCGIGPNFIKALAKMKP